MLKVNLNLWCLVLHSFDGWRRHQLIAPAIVRFGDHQGNLFLSMKAGLEPIPGRISQ